MAKSKKDAKKDAKKGVKKEKKKAPSFPVPKEKFDVAVPEGFTWGKHKTLKKNAFQADHLYFTHRAKECEIRGVEFTAKAAEAKILGSGKERNKAKRLQKMQAKMEELRAELESQGIDVDELLATDE